MTLSINDLLFGLNEKQKKAVQVTNGKYLVLASAGSGKTRVLTNRIGYLIALGVKPWEIVGITFTKKAANEIKERVHGLIGEQALDVNMGTFHSLCMRILLQNQEALGMSNLTILDETESKKIIEDISITYGYLQKDAVYKIKSQLDRWANEGWLAEDVASKGNFESDFINIYKEYTDFKRQVGYVDFNDLINLTIELFNKRPDILEKYSKKYKYIMLDEGQDTNNPQFELLKQLSSYHENYMIISDDLQAIYSFRGSNVDNILNIRDFDSEIETILLEQNYRSSKTIVQSSNLFIKNNKKQLEKNSYTENPKGHPIFIYDSIDETREAEFIVSAIEGFVQNKGMNYEDFAVLYRSNYLSRNIELSFGFAGIPYTVVGGSEFYERQEIKGLVSYLRAIDNLKDDLAFERILTTPKRGIGATSIDRLKMFATEAQVPFSKAMEMVEDIAKINKPTKKKIKETFDLILNLQTQISENNITILNLLKNIVIKTHFMGQYDTDKSSDVQRIQNIEELFNVASQFDNKEKIDLTEDQTLLTQFLTETSLYIEPGKEDDTDKVSLLTVHSSKGLEYKVVFVIGVQDGTFPSSLTQTEEDYEEERRLMYVAMTRAKEILFLSYNRKKYFRGNVVDTGPSQFIKEMPQQHVRYLGIKKPDNS